VQKDVTNDLSVLQLLQAATNSEDYEALCEAWRSKPSSLKDIQAKLDSSNDYNAAAEHMWRTDVAKGVQSKGSGCKKSREDDLRSMSSLSTACSLNSAKESSHNQPGQFHLAGIVGALSEAPPAPVSQRFLDLLETGSEDSDEDQAERISEEEAWQSFSSEAEEQKLERQTLQEAVERIARPSLRSLSSSVVIADPSNGGFPVLCCSTGFQTLTGFSEADMVGRDFRSLFGNMSICTSPGLQIRTQWRTFCDFAVTGRLFAGPTGGGSAILGDEMETVRLPEGELAFVQDFFCKSRDSFCCLVYLKQVELDDRPYVVAVQSRLPRLVALEGERLRDAFLKLNEDLDEAICAMAGEFFYFAPMRRQIAYGPSDSGGDFNGLDGRGEMALAVF